MIFTLFTSALSVAVNPILYLIALLFILIGIFSVDDSPKGSAVFLTFGIIAGLIGVSQ